MSGIKPLNKKAHRMSSLKAGDVKGYSVEGCCPSFIPGWEVGADNQIDPCPWQQDLAACHGFLFFCFWAGQVPDNWNNPSWLNSCGNIQTDWTNLCVVPD